MDAADRELFIRSIRAAIERHSGRALDAALDELGWNDALASDTRDAVSILFEQQGAGNATSSALGRVLADTLGVDAGGVLLPALGQSSPPATQDGDSVVVDGIAMGSNDVLVVVARSGDKDTAVTVAAADLESREVHGVDPSLELQQVHGTVGAAAPQPVDWAAALALGQCALAHELVGASRTMLELARVHALERVQFDRPIAMFQAVRHRLADTLVAIETAEAALDAAWLDGTPLTAAMAKALAGRGARTAARHCQQVLAGIGFTTEHSLHLFIRRTLVLDQLLGSSKQLTHQLGRELLTSRRLPPLLPL